MNALDLIKYAVTSAYDEIRTKAEHFYMSNYNHVIKHIDIVTTDMYILIPFYAILIVLLMCVYTYNLKVLKCEVDNLKRSVNDLTDKINVINWVNEISNPSEPGSESDSDTGSECSIHDCCMPVTHSMLVDELDNLRDTLLHAINKRTPQPQANNISTSENYLASIDKTLAVLAKDLKRHNGKFYQLHVKNHKEITEALSQLTVENSGDEHAA